MPSQILAIKLRALGDTVLLMAPLKELSLAHPRAQLHVLVKEQWAPLLQGIPWIHKVWTLPPQSNFFSRVSLLPLAYRLRKERYDWVINFHASSSSSWLALATGAPTRSIHFHGHREANHHSTVEIPGKGVLKPIIERDMDALRALGIHVPAGRIPKLEVSRADSSTADEWLRKMNLSSPVLGLGLGASRPTKCWPLERFAGLAIEWILKKNGSVLAFANQNEEGLIHAFLKSVDDLLSTIPETEIRAQVRSKLVATYQLELKSLTALLSRLSVLVANDSGPKHLAISVGTPTVTLFGPEHPFEWHPYPRDQHPYFFNEALTCRESGDSNMPPWCGLSECVVEEHRCMTLTGVNAVFSACEKVGRAC